MEDISLALKQMHTCKASGQDGMPPLFFQKYWTLVGCPSASNTLLQAPNLGVIPRDLNHMHITMIPKKKKTKQGFGLSSN